MRHLLFILFSLIMTPNLFAQFCEGDLGENIFTEGDFGAGTANVLLTDPGIAPGYIYITNPPPLDGEYLITNNIALWGDSFDWIQPQDNSDDPNGYMLVVNASIAAGLFYEQQIDGLCENTLYEFSADIINLLNTTNPNIKPNVSFLIDGTESFSTGDIPENGTWNTYGFTFTTTPGQTSVVLALQNNAPGGQGNDLAIDNIAFRACGPQTVILPAAAEEINICADGAPLDLNANIIGTEYDSPAIQWQQSFDGGITWEDIVGANDFTFTHSELIDGDYYYRYILANGNANLSNEKCRVISSSKIINVIPNLLTTTIDTICDGLDYMLGGNSFNTSGTYKDTLVSSTGCDSIVTLELTVVPDTDITANITPTNITCTDLTDGTIVIDSIMNGALPYSFFIDGEMTNAQTLNLAIGNYQVTITDRYGCSLENNLNIESPPSFTIDIGDDMTIALGETVSLEVITDNDVEDYFWTPAELNDDCTDPCDKIAFAPLNNMAVTVKASTLSGCEAQDSIFITINKNTNIAIPSAFSPNGDGLNDFFGFQGNLPIIQEIQSFRVFNRWGQVVYNATNNTSSNGWDGTIKDTPAPLGVYPYAIDILFIDGEIITYQGAVTLLR